MPSTPGRVGAYDVSISVVVFRPDFELLTATLRSLAVALVQAHDAGFLASATVWLIDNGSADSHVIDRLIAEVWAPRPEWLTIAILRGHGNVGYGRGHNLAIERATGAYHLVLNPDVLLDPAALIESIRYLEAHPQVGLVTPYAVGAAGERQYLCKRYPSLLALALRGFAPRGIQRRFVRRLDHYEMRDLAVEQTATDIPIASGCYMFARLPVLRTVGGFSPAYFLYFEDFDLSLKVRRAADIAYVPQVRIVHAGGGAARKGWTHRRLFIRSAFTFFRQHGWRLW